MNEFIKWLWKYEYFVNLRKMVLSTKHFKKNYLIYGNIMLFLVTMDKLIFITPLQVEVTWFCSPSPPLIRGSVIYFTPSPKSLPPHPSGNDDSPFTTVCWCSSLPSYVPDSQHPMQEKLHKGVTVDALWDEWLKSGWANARLLPWAKGVAC